MDDRVDLLPDNALVSVIEGLERDSLELKSAFQRIGSESVLARITSSSNAYDWSGVLTTDPTAGPPYGHKSIRVNATAMSMSNLFGELFVYMYVGSPSNWYRPLNYLADVAGFVSIPFQSRIFDYPSDVTDLKKKSWDVVLTGDDTTMVYLKFFVVASDATT